MVTAYFESVFDFQMFPIYLNIFDCRWLYLTERTNQNVSLGGHTECLELLQGQRSFNRWVELQCGGRSFSGVGGASVGVGGASAVVGGFSRVGGSLLVQDQKSILIHLYPPPSQSNSTGRQTH